MVGNYRAPSACVCPVDGREYPADGFPCDFRVCESDPKVRLVPKEEEIER